MQFCMDNSGKTAISWHASGRMSSTVITGLDQGPILFHSDCCLARTAMLDSNILMQQESSFLNCKQNSRHLKLSQNCCLFFPQSLEAMQETDLVWHQQAICHRQFVKLLMSWQNQVNDMCPQSWWQFWHQDHFPWSIPLEMTSWNFLLVTAWAQQCNFLKTHEVACHTKTQEHMCLPHSVALQHAGSMASPTKIWAHQLCENEQRSDAVPLRAINIHVVQFIHSSDCFPLICAASNMHRTDLIDRWVLQSQLLVSQSPRKSSLSSCACWWARKKWKFTCRTPLFIIKKFQAQLSFDDALPVLMWVRLPSAMDAAQAASKPSGLIKLQSVSKLPCACDREDKTISFSFCWSLSSGRFISTLSTPCLLVDVAPHPPPVRKSVCPFPDCFLLQRRGRGNWLVSLVKVRSMHLSQCRNAEHDCCAVLQILHVVHPTHSLRHLLRMHIGHISESCVLRETWASFCISPTLDGQIWLNAGRLCCMVEPSSKS